MLKIITSKSSYQFSPELATDTVSCDLPLTLWGKQWYIMDDYWMKHIHLKITDRCNAACPFCIEQNSHIEENKKRFWQMSANCLTKWMLKDTCRRYLLPVASRHCATMRARSWIWSDAITVS